MFQHLSLLIGQKIIDVTFQDVPDRFLSLSFSEFDGITIFNNYLYNRESVLDLRGSTIENIVDSSSNIAEKHITFLFSGNKKITVYLNDDDYDNGAEAFVVTLQNGTSVIVQN